MTEKRTCKLCGQTILLVESGSTGRPLALECEPDPGGSHFIALGKAYLAEDGLLMDMLGFVRFHQHTATCPNRPKRPEPAT